MSAAIGVLVTGARDGVHLIHAPDEPAIEHPAMELRLRTGVRLLAASA